MRLTQSLELEEFLEEFKEYLEDFSDTQKTALYVELDDMTEFYEEAMSKNDVIQWLKTDVKMDLISDLKEKYPHIEKYAKQYSYTFEEALEDFTRVYSIDDGVALYQPQPLEKENIK